MLENLKRSEFIPYLFKAKNITGGVTKWSVWDDMLKDLPDEAVKYAVEKALMSNEKITATMLRKWTLNYSENKTEYKLQNKYKTLFCDSCLRMQKFDCTFSDFYCTVCSNKYIESRATEIQKQYHQGLLEDIKKKREIKYGNIGKFIVEEVK